MAINRLSKMALAQVLTERELGELVGLYKSLDNSRFRLGAFLARLRPEVALEVTSRLGMSDSFVADLLRVHDDFGYREKKGFTWDTLAALTRFGQAIEMRRVAQGRATDSEVASLLEGKIPLGWRGG